MFGTGRNTVGAEAETAKHARDLAASKAEVFAQATGYLAPKVHSPWYEPTLVTCELDRARDDVPHGTVVTAAGRPLP